MCSFHTGEQEYQQQKTGAETLNPVDQRAYQISHPDTYAAKCAEHLRPTASHHQQLKSSLLNPEGLARIAKPRPSADSTPRNTKPRNLYKPYKPYRP